MKDTTFTLRIDRITLDILKKKSKEQKMTNSEYIRFLIRLSDMINMPFRLNHYTVESEVQDIDEAD